MLAIGLRVNKEEGISPLDGKSSHTGLLSKDVAAYVLNKRLGRGVCCQLLAIVLIVHIVADSNEFSAVVAASEEDDGHAQHFRGRNAVDVRSGSLEDELVHPDRNGTNQEGVKFLVILRAVTRSEYG